MSNRWTTLLLVAWAFCKCQAPINIASEKIDPTTDDWIKVRPELAQVGFEAALELTVEAVSPLARNGNIRWQQLSGPPLELKTERNGFVLRSQTHALATLRPGPLPSGIVPFSATSRGDYVLEGTWQGPGHVEVRRRVHITATARASGLPGVGVDHRVVLAGAHWQLSSAPFGAKASISHTRETSQLVPDVPGHWTLRDADGQPLLLNVARYDQTRLDCGRNECHPRAAELALESPMATILERGLDGLLGLDYHPGCAIACHSVGEPGTRDGGFADAVATVHVDLPEIGHAGGWAQLPRPLRQLGGVGCTSCHGPGAIPPLNLRDAILRSDVCAVCHDAPPSYGHFAAWSRSKMAHADDRPETQAEGCADCHTTAGFLAKLGARPPTANAKWIPTGISCQACHAPHGQRGEHAQLRSVPLSPALESGRAVGTALETAIDERTRLCLACHAPPELQAPTPSAGAIWLGRGALDVETGAPLNGLAPHALLHRGCLLCHASGALRVEHGAGHGFAVDGAVCTRCHEDRSAKSQTVTERAQRLWRRLFPGEPMPQSGLAHASPLGLRRHPMSKSDRLRHDLLLVLEDPAAGAHNYGYARAILDHVERR
jgi:hypothetical protein